jgi:AraC family transcriptional regulator of adaptative response / DNA-3-methyladenine glycosylase II
VIEDADQCYLAVQSRDPRFDGWFFTAVTTTGIYCRPSCPARTPHRDNVRFYPSAAAAQQAGFRACKRCRPDATPGSPEWDARADVVARAMRLIADGVVDREGVPALAARLGYSVRQLQRTLSDEVGAGPLAVARTQRAQTARVLIETTDLPMAEVAFAAGFASIRQFNDTVRTVFAATPSGLRVGGRDGGRRRPLAADASPLVLRLPFRQPLCPDPLFGHLAATAVPGVEEVRGRTYRRTLRLDHGPGVVELTPAPRHILCRVSLTDLRDLTAAIARCRWLLDLDADPLAVDTRLAADPGLRPMVEAAPGRRVPRSVDGGEMALRAVLGQQISTAAASTLTARLVNRHGERLPSPDGGLTHLFPTPADLVEVGPALGPALPAGRLRILETVARALADGRLSVGPGTDRTQAREVLADLRGVGPWTTEMIAMRGLGDPDAFPVTDVGVRRGAEACGMANTPAALMRRAHAWRPWRSYAVQYLWTAHHHPVDQWPPSSGTTTPRTSRGDR